MHEQIEQAARIIATADSLLITAGAGMGVDSGLPDFRGNEGFWRAYPALAGAGIAFTSIANPAAFRRNPQQAWGFYGHRLALYRSTLPHAGFAMLRELAATMPQGAFVVTSNVDGQFQKAGFAANQVLEIHGSIHHLQCSEPCQERYWPADALQPQTDDAACRWLGELPTCPHCGALARPNILMFNDAGWVATRQSAQWQQWESWRQQGGRRVVIECGAGVDVPSIRYLSERQDSPLIRINPRHPDLPVAGVSLPLGANAALQQIRVVLQAMGKLPG